MCCRINRRRLWAHRILLESLKHEFNCFVTLTYDSKLFGPGYGRTLVPQDTREWLNRLRFHLAKVNRNFRYYLVGEYGDETFRPHYHVALFGVSFIEVELINRTWGLGFVHVGELNKDSAQYLAGYVTKKMTKASDIRLQGRHPEFARQSNGGGKAFIKGGIGSPAVDDLVDVLTSQFGVNAVQNNKDVPTSVLVGKKQMPLGRYLRAKIRERIASEKGCQKIKYGNLNRYAEEMRGLLEASRADQGPSGSDPSSRGYVSVREVLRQENAGKIAAVEGRLKIFSRREL